MSGLLSLLKISRPRFWFYTFGPYLLGVTAAAASRNELIDWRVILFAVYFLFPANLLIYGINDIFDYETDRLNAKKENYETLVDRSQHRGLWIAILLTNIPFVIASLIVSRSAALALAGFLFFSIFYSAKPIRAKGIPFLDSAFNILYLYPGVFGYVLVYGEWPPFRLLVAAGLWTAAMHAYSAVPDIDADKNAGLNTIATVLGPYITVIFCAFLYLGSALFVVEYLGFLTFPLASVYVIIMLASLRSIRTGTLFRLYRAFPIINAVAGFLIFWQIALNKFF
jgi:lycopene elongase/hydratase (dihydrobisanhydrobacterioruberin-forming)